MTRRPNFWMQQYSIMREPYMYTSVYYNTKQLSTMYMYMYLAYNELYMHTRQCLYALSIL